MALARDITVIGASAGGVTAVRDLVRGLPPGYPAAVFVVVHVAPESPGLLHQLLARASALPVRMASAPAPIRAGEIVVAPPDHHLVVEHDHARISHGPRENRHRPAIDVLFRSAAAAHGPRVMGVVLTGLLDDGAAGLWAVKRRGGISIVQDPDDAEYPDMPRNALATVDADLVLPLALIPQRLAALAAEPMATPAAAPPADMAQEVRMAADDEVNMEQLDTLGTRVPFTCPECGGTLWEMQGGGPQRYRCHVGHAYSIQTFMAEQSVRVEGALWAALRSLEENERLSRRMAHDAAQRGSDRSARSFGEHARTSAAHAEVLRELLARATDVAPAGPEAGTAAAALPGRGAGGVR
jgi:two-component system chemotaxis response regulator CheB